MTIDANHAVVLVTYQRQTQELPQPVYIDSSDSDIKAWVAEAIENGDLEGITAARVDLTDFSVDRIAPTEHVPHNIIQVRPKTPFGTVTNEEVYQVLMTEDKLKIAEVLGCGVDVAEHILTTGISIVEQMASATTIRQFTPGHAHAGLIARIMELQAVEIAKSLYTPKQAYEDTTTLALIAIQAIVEIRRLQKHVESLKAALN